MSIFDSLKNVAASVTSSTAGSIVDSISNGISKFVNTPEDKEKAKEFEATLQQSIQTALDAHQEKMATLYEQQYESQLKDVDSARQMQIAALKQESFWAKNQIHILACAVTLGFFGILAYMLKYDVPPANKDILNIILGSLGTAWVSIIGFYFGSSKSSQAKDETIKQLSQ